MLPREARKELCPLGVPTGLKILTGGGGSVQIGATSSALNSVLSNVRLIIVAVWLAAKVQPIPGIYARLTPVIVAEAGDELVLVRKAGPQTGAASGAAQTPDATAPSWSTLRMFAVRLPPSNTSE